MPVRLNREERLKHKRLTDSVTETILANATQVEKDYLMKLGTRLLVKDSLKDVHYLAMPEEQARRALLSYSNRHIQIAIETERTQQGD